MTEEIIINGVDVARCELFYSAYNENMCARVDGLTCGEDNNCHYKQLKRLEQENEKLKEENKTLNYQWHKQSEIGDEWYKIAERYRSALEEIREIASPHCSQCVEIIDKINEVLGNESN